MFKRPLFLPKPVSCSEFDRKLFIIEKERVESRCRSSAIDLRAGRRALERALKHSDDCPSAQLEEELVDAIGKIDCVLNNLLKGY